MIIVRHAKAMDRKDWSRKDAARPLNSRGRRQAGLLVPMLAAYGITRLVSSTATRCLNTLLPYAHQQEILVDSYSQLTEEEGADDAKGVSKLITKIRPRLSRAVSRRRSACTGRCCRTSWTPWRWPRPRW